MRINTKKTKTMIISKKEGKEVKITIYGERIEQVQKFCYLGSLITEDARCKEEVKRRIAMGKEAFYQRKELMKGGLDRNLKKRLIKTLIWSVTLYGSETWTLRKEEMERIEAFEMWIWRRMEKISWTEHKTNEEVLKQVEEKREMINTIRKRQKTWMGHIMRGDSLLREIMEGQLKGKRTRGRPRNMLLDWMMEKDYKDLKERAMNRNEWRNWNTKPA